MGTARLLAFLIVISILALGACGHRSKPTVVQGFSPGSKTSPEGLDYPRSIADALAQLDALVCPEGVDGELWAELKDALSAALLQKEESRLSSRDSGGKESRLENRDSFSSDGRFTSAPPSGEANRINDLAVADNGDRTFTLRWHYRNLGDYDQNGSVGISDITPLAQHFGETYDPEAEPDCIQAVIDGNGNGVVDIADLGAIAVNLGVSCSKYCVLGGLDLAEPFQFVREVPLQEAAGEGRREFSAVLENVSRFYFCVYPLDTAGKAGAPSEPVMLPGGAPVIEDVVQTSNHDGETVTFGARITDGIAVQYHWDFGGYAEPNISAEPEPIVLLQGEGGSYPVLTVSNPLGESTYYFNVYRLSEPYIQSVYPAYGQCGKPLRFSAEVVGTEPLEYYWDFGGGSEPSTSHVKSPTVILGWAGNYEACLTVDNRWGTTKYPFTLVVGNEPAAALPPSILDVQAQGISASTTTLTAAVQGTPPLTYTWRLGGAAIPSTCSVVSPTVLLGASGEYRGTLVVTNAAGEDSFAFDLSVLPIPTVTVEGRICEWPDGNEGVPDIAVEVVDCGLPPAITDSDGYHAIPGAQIGEHTIQPVPEPGRVFVPRAATIDVTESFHTVDFKTSQSDWQVRAVDYFSPGYGKSNSLAVINGCPAVSYHHYNWSASALMLKRAEDADGLSWSAEPIAVSVAKAFSPMGAYNTLAVVAGKPVIVCADAPNYCRALDSSGLSWNSALHVTQATHCSLTSLLVVGLKPAILYNDRNAGGEIRYIRALDPAGNLWGTSSLVSVSDVGSSNRLGFAVINGLPAVAYPDASSWPPKTIYRRALDLNGYAWSAPVVVCENWGSEHTVSLIEVEGHPALLHMPGIASLDTIYYVRAEDAVGDTWGEQVSVYRCRGSVSVYTGDVVTVNGRLATVCGDSRGDVLLFLESEDALGMVWREPRLIDCGEFKGYASVALVSGHPAVVYSVEQGVQDELRYAVYMPE